MESKGAVHNASPAIIGVIGYGHCDIDVARKSNFCTDRDCEASDQCKTAAEPHQFAADCRQCQLGRRSAIPA
jgi:hypothetical protein